jgi:hypothetical protein
MWHVWKTGEVHAGFRRGHLREKDHLEDLGVDGRIMLKWMLKNWVWGGGGMDWIDLARDRDRWMAVVNAEMNLGFP